MAKQLALWRDSASLIILSKWGQKSSKEEDYKLLLFGRSNSASFMPSSSVFPGGVHEKEDESPLWLKYFQNFGVKEDQLKKLLITRRPELQPQPHIFKKIVDDQLHRDISLRITAIRETFEEMGIMLCRDRKSFITNDGFGRVHQNFDRSKWQLAVHRDPSEFLKLCQELDVIPDLWSLKEWSVWLTPTTFSKRFETVFYLVPLETPPDVLLESKEGMAYNWVSPKDAIGSHRKGELFLPPPQLLELSRFLNFDSLDELHNFAIEREIKGVICMFPVLVQCTDGIVSVLPGDSNYPSDSHSINGFTKVDMTVAQFRRSAKKLNRSENSNTVQQRYYLNFDMPDGHLRPFSIGLESKL